MISILSKGGRSRPKQRSPNRAFLFYEGVFCGSIGYMTEQMNFGIGRELLNLHKAEQARRELLKAYRLDSVAGLESEAEKFSMLFLVDGASHFEPNPSLIETSQEASDLVEKIRARYKKINQDLNTLKEQDPNGSDKNFIQDIQRIKETIDHQVLKAERVSGVTIIGIPEPLDEALEENKTLE